MAKVLKITKQDKSVHVSPLSNKPFLEAYNKRMPGDKKLKIEEVDESEVKDHSFLDESYVTAVEAQKRAADLLKSNSEKDGQIAELQKRIAELSAGGSTGSTGPKLEADTEPKKSAEELIKLIHAATKVDDIQALIAGDTRKTVATAAEKRIAELSAGGN